MKKNFLLFSVVFVFCFTFFSIKKEKSRSVANVSTQSVENYLYGDLGGINPHTARANALPWAFAKYILEYGAKQLGIINHDQSWVDALKAAGFLFPESIDGVPLSVATANGQSLSKYGSPAGVSVKEVKVKVPLSRFKYNAMNITCAACHSSPSYNQNGLPDPNSIWLGAPSPSVNYALYADMLYAGIQYGVQTNWNGIFKKKFKTNSKLSLVEYVAIQTVIYKYFKDNKVDCRKNMDSYCVSFKQRHPSYNTDKKIPGVLLPFSPGAPGTTNGVAMLSYYTKTLKDLGSIYGFTSIPSFADRKFKSSYLYDGFYMSSEKKDVSRFTEVDRTELPSGKFYEEQLASVIAMFTVPVMGTTIKQATGAAVVDEVKKVIPLVLNYESKKFPGKVNFSEAKRGYKIYEKNCSSCHGNYKWEEGEKYPYLYSFPNKLTSLEDIKTDRERTNAYVKDVLSPLIKGTFVGENIIIKSPDKSNRGYVGTPLGELWLSAPYLHNGTVPTLWHLLRPSKRPSKFLVGGHKLDFSKVGISYKVGDTTQYEDGFMPYSQPVIIDTNRRGFSNSGHELEFNLIETEKEKDELLEFLKLI